VNTNSNILRIIYNIMHKDKNGNFIGIGEDSTFEILKEMYPNKEIKRQVKLTSLLSQDWIDDLGEIQRKETLDLVIYDDPIIVVRVQDKHHTGAITAARDVIQKATLEWNDCIVVDLFHYECKNLMKERVNSDSRREILLAFRSEGVVPNL